MFNSKQEKFAYYNEKNKPDYIKPEGFWKLVVIENKDLGRRELQYGIYILSN